MLVQIPFPKDVNFGHKEHLANLLLLERVGWVSEKCNKPIRVLIANIRCAKRIINDAYLVNCMINVIVCAALIQSD